jgi:excisionase family DNA binding protein
MLPTPSRRHAPLTLQEVAGVCGYHYAYVRQLVSRGTLKSHKEGKYRYVRVCDLRAYVKTKSDIRLEYLEARLSMVEASAR